MMIADSGVLRLSLTPRSERFDPDDDRWAAQELELLTALRREVGGVRREASAAPGEKGAVETVTLALASAGAFTAAFECLQTWLTRDRTRRIEIAYTVDGAEEQIVLEGTDVDRAAMARVTEVALARLERRA